MKRVLAGAAVLVAVGIVGEMIPSPTRAATFSVNNTADGDDANRGDGVCEVAPGTGACTLRAAIREANALPGADAVNLPAGT